MKPVHIYKLIDPRDLNIKYIGKTSRLLSERLSSHVWEAKKVKRKNKRTSWIKSLLVKNLKPIIELIETCENNEIANERERYYIKLYNDLDLKNMQPGGDGQPPGYKFKKRYIPPKGKIPEYFKKYPHPSTRSDWKEIVAKIIKNRKAPKEKIKLRKAVILYDILENKVIEFDSVKAAAKFLEVSSIDISERCRNIRQSLIKEKYTCSWKKDGIKKEYKHPYHKVIKYKDQETIEYRSILSASKDCKIKRNTIYNCLKTGEPDKNGYYWKTK